jgi:hypothetical protein
MTEGLLVAEVRHYRRVACIETKDMAGGLLAAESM